MTAAWFADRLRLYELLHTHPDWGTMALAQHLGRSRSWVKRWRRRFGSPPHPDPLTCCRAQPTATTRRSGFSESVMTAILALRESLTAHLHRVAGAKTILYHLHHDPELVHERLPRSATTIWKLLDQHQQIMRPPRRTHTPLDLPPPMTEVEIDFTDIASIPCDEDGKRAHAGEAFNWVDAGTSIPVASVAGDAFCMETAIRVSTDLLGILGVPPTLRCDRDPRLVGNVQDDFPAPFLRLWAALGVPVDRCPPHRPDKKAYVERYQRTLKTECLRPLHPTTIPEAQAIMDAWREQYVLTRPHQGRACQNQPPAVAFPDLPGWPPLPTEVDPDAWVRSMDGAVFVRRVKPNGTILLDTRAYSVGRALAGREVVVQIDAARQEVVILVDEQEHRRRPLKGVVGSCMPFDAYVELLCAESRSMDRRVQERQRRSQRPRGR